MLQGSGSFNDVFRKELPESFVKFHFYSRYFTPPPSPQDTWFVSRIALIRVIQSLLDQRLDLSQIQISLSHTHSASCAVAALGAQLGVGVDLEDRSRPVSRKAADRFIDSNEAKLPFQPIDVWTIKEACYKANPENQNTIIADYQIDSVGWASLRNHPSQRFQFQFLSDSEWALSFAVHRSVSIDS